MSRRAVATILVLALAAGAAARAQEAVATVASSSTSEEEQELQQLMSVLQEETAVATRTRMNSDYVPGIVTVLQGEELEALGFRFVWDALAMVPGIQPVRGNSASPSTVVRGIQFPFNSGNIKILLDGVPLTRQSSALNGSVLFLPIEQVDRVEVIRGPGSVVYGDFAFMGLINILTRKDGVRVHLRGDDDGLVSGGARASYGDADSPWQLSANLTAEHDGQLDVVEPREAKADDHMAIVSLRHGGFGLEGQWIDADRDDVSAAGTPGANYNGNERTWALEARYERELARGLQAAVHVDTMGTDATGGPIHFEDRLNRGEANVTWEGWSQQSWLAGVEYNGQDIQQASLAPAPPPGQPPPPQLLIDGKQRDVWSLVLQDRVDLGAWSVTLGARYDDYSDVGSRVTPRVSLVFRQSDRHIWKAQYAEGFRAPTFFEAYSGPGNLLNRDLDFEINRTTELNYVYRVPQATGRVTLYHSDLDDMIFLAPPRFANTRHARSNGLELEWTQQIAGKLKLLANASKANTSDDRGPTLATHESQANPLWMGDLALLLQASPRALVALHWNHVDDRRALPGRDAYDLMDLTFNASDLLAHGIGLRAGVRNALDDQAIYVQVPPAGILAGDRYSKRTFWAQLSWRR